LTYLFSTAGSFSLSSAAAAAAYFLLLFLSFLDSLPSSSRSLTILAYSSLIFLSLSSLYLDKTSISSNWPRATCDKILDSRP